MKKNLLRIIIIIFTITGCERDDICIDPITPDLIISFYDAEDPEAFKSVSNLKVVVIISAESIYETTVSGDSIALPIRIDQDFTDYEFTLEVDGNELSDDINLSYSREEEIVGRSCGFKTIFNNVTVNVQNTPNWIQELQIETPLSITDETSAHVKIFH